MRVCIITPGETTPTETFIRAHLERLPHEITHLSGYYLRYRCDQGLLRDLHCSSRWRGSERLINLLPRYAEFRLRKRWFEPPADETIVETFLRDRQIDVVLAEYGMTGAFVHSVCRAAGIPLVVHFHGADATQQQYLHVHAHDYRSMFESAAAVIAVSQRMGGDLIRLGCPEARLRLCPYGPHPDFFQVEPGSNSNTVVAIGRLTPKKAPHLTILAFAQALQACPDLRLVVIGDGELRGVCRDLIESLHLADKVEIRGVATHEEVRRRLADAFLFVQHSVQADDGDCEGTPLAVLEAGAAGLPVLATRHAGIPDVVMEGETGLLVDERDVDAMSRQLVRLASDRGLARRLGQRARQHIAENFSMQRHIDSLSQVLEEALQPSPTQ